MENKSPLVSIVMATYNGSLYLAEQMESLMAQSYKNLEIIVVDDCSGDNTVEIFRRKNHQSILSATKPTSGI
jgi:glycosyltransferase involved in cell wall biosynthesis